MKSTPSLTTSKPPRLRVGLKDVSREEFSTALNAQLGKQRVSIMIDGATFQVGISIGHCLATEGERDASKLIKQADVAMYEDKRLKPLRKTTSGTEAHGGFAMTTG